MGIRPLQAGFDGFESPEPDHALFYAVLPPKPLGMDAYALARHLKQFHRLTGEPMDPSRLHITLQKLGEFVGPPPVSLVAGATEAAARIEVQAFDLVFDEVLNLGNPADPVVALSGGNAPQTVAPLWEALRLSLARVGLKTPANLSMPHMTLIYGSSTLQRQPVSPLQWRVQELVLVESLIGRSQHRHLGRWPLQVESGCTDRA
jgi:2'-5' RNA ligase